MNHKTPAKPLKVAIISNSTSSLLNFRGPLIVEMVRRGHTVLAFAPDYDDTTRAALKAMGAQTVDYQMSRAGLNPLRDMVTLVELASLLKRHKPDISFSYFVKPVIYGTIAAWIAKVKHRFAMIEGMGFVFTAGDSPSPARRLLQWTATWLFRISLGFAERLIVLNSDDYKEFVTRRLIASERVSLLGGIGVDLQQWSYELPSTTPVCFMFVGRLLRDKGAEEFVSAAAKLREKGHNARFVMLGGHDENPTAIPLGQIQSWVAQGIVEWPGHVPVQPLLRQASVFVLPSYREGVPRSTQEAMAMGLPVVTTDVPGCRETVAEGVNGFLVPARDAAALADAMEFFIRHPDRITLMGAESRRMAEENFDVHLQNKKLLSLIGL